MSLKTHSAYILSTSPHVEFFTNQSLSRDIWCTFYPHLLLFCIFSGFLLLFLISPVISSLVHNNTWHHVYCSLVALKNQKPTPKTRKGTTTTKTAATSTTTKTAATSSSTTTTTTNNDKQQTTTTNKQRQGKERYWKCFMENP
jgi:uncharacterized membrane protein YraQ (UPF0718 family)